MRSFLLDRRISLFLEPPSVTPSTTWPSRKRSTGLGGNEVRNSVGALLPNSWAPDFSVAAVVGSGIMGERLAAGNIAVALLANTIATGAALLALIFTFGAISGAHLNPAVTLALAVEQGIPWREVPAYVTAQCAGGIAGTILAHLMFGLRWYSFSSRARGGWALVLSEFIATFGLLAVIWGCCSPALRLVRSSHRRGQLYRCCLLVHGLNLVLRESCGDHCAVHCRTPLPGFWPVDAPWFVVAQIAGALAAKQLFFGGSCPRKILTPRRPALAPSQRQADEAYPEPVLSLS